MVMLPSEQISFVPRSEEQKKKLATSMPERFLLWNGVGTAVSG